MSQLNEINSRGLFLVVYGANNLGKSEQTKRLATLLISEGNQILVIKYPIYHLEPTGPKINKILRDPLDPDRNLSEFEFQKLYAQNRKDFQEVIVDLLNAGVSVIAEDYTGTGLSWGMTRGVKLDDLEIINEGLLKPDLAILLEGDRFNAGVEVGHRNESDIDQVWEKNRQAHHFLAEKYRWEVVNANYSIDEVHQAIVNVVQKAFGDKFLIKMPKTYIDKRP